VAIAPPVLQNQPRGAREGPVGKESNKLKEGRGKLNVERR